MNVVPDALTPRRPELAGTCEKAVKHLVREDPSLTAVAGWYHDALWGTREHWWAVTESGEIVDPTVEQFPTGHLPALRVYEPYSGFYPCPGCGIAVACARREDAGDFCCGSCHGATIGFPCGPCECTDARDQTEETTR